MLKRFNMIIGILGTVFFLASAEVREFRLDQDRLWLSAENEPLPQLLERFAEAGVRVAIDPVARKSVSGEWQNRDVETALDAILSPNSYQLDWERNPGPLGPMTRLTGIRVFREGHADGVRTLRGARRIETSLDGSLRFMAREILIGFGPGSTLDDLRLFLARTGGTVIDANTELGIYRILLPEGVNISDLAAQLANDPSIALAELNYIYDLPGLLPGGDPGAGASKPWSAPSGDGTVAVSVLDSGLIYNDGLSSAVLNAFDATNPDTPLTADAVGHGTLMAKIAAGLVDPYNTAIGEGVPVIAIKAFTDDGSANAFTLMNAMTHALEKSSGPVSLSWGSETSSKMIETAVHYAINHGSPVFAAVGNKKTGTPMYPAACDGVIGVAAGTADGQYTDYSNEGDFVDIIAPGSAGGSQGTSVSTAYVAHIAAKYQRHHPKASAAEIGAALINAAGPDRYLSEEEVRRLLVK